MTPIFYIKGGYLNFGHSTLLQDIELYIYPGDRICLIGRNGSGKSSLLKVIFQEYQLDKGELFKIPNILIGYLKQDLHLSLSSTINDFLLEQFTLEENNQYKADIVLSNLQLDGDLELSKCSGGQLRRAFLAKVLIQEPQILLLDEPTNHLDISTIEWLEGYVRNYNGAIVCISHDRAFLSATTNKVWWIDRGILRSSDKGFKFFDTWQEEVIRQEEIHLKKLGKKLETENDWLNKGVTARRKRNQKRLSDLSTLKEICKNHSDKLSHAKEKLNIELSDNIKKANFVIEAEDISFSYQNIVDSAALDIKNKQQAERSVNYIINNFSFRVKKGEKIGVIGPNGAGKSTFIKILIGAIKPSIGKIKYGFGLEISYIDQNRIELNPNHSIKEVLCAEGGDQIFLADKIMHVTSYLKQFMFDPKSINYKVSTLSGGQASRLLLAKTLIKPGNLLILDEPTNDLDMDSLEILLETLSEYKGTLLVVSHDRDFLEKLVTRTLIFTPGKIIDLIGGYEDYKKLIKDNKETLNTTRKSVKSNIKKVANDKDKKLSYKFQRAITEIPKEIDKLELRVSEIEQILAKNNNMFLTNHENFKLLIQELASSKERIDKLMQEWMDIR